MRFLFSLLVFTLFFGQTLNAEEIPAACKAAAAAAAAGPTEGVSQRRLDRRLRRCIRRANRAAQSTNTNSNGAETEANETISAASGSGLGSMTDGTVDVDVPGAKTNGVLGPGIDNFGAQGNSPTGLGLTAN